MNTEKKKSANDPPSNRRYFSLIVLGWLLGSAGLALTGWKLVEVWSIDTTEENSRSIQLDSNVQDDDTIAANLNQAYAAWKQQLEYSRIQSKEQLRIYGWIGIGLTLLGCGISATWIFANKLFVPIRRSIIHPALIGGCGLACFTMIVLGHYEAPQPAIAAPSEPRNSQAEPEIKIKKLDDQEMTHLDDLNNLLTEKPSPQSAILQLEKILIELNDMPQTQQTLKLINDAESQLRNLKSIETRKSLKQIIDKSAQKPKSKDSAEKAKSSAKNYFDRKKQE